MSYDRRRDARLFVGDVPLGFTRDLPVEGLGLRHAGKHGANRAFGTPIGGGRKPRVRGRFARLPPRSRRRRGRGRRTRSRGANQARVLGLSPAFTRVMHGRLSPRFAGENPVAVTFDHRQDRRTLTLGTPRQRVAGLGIGVATLGEFSADVIHPPARSSGPRRAAPPPVSSQSRRACLKELVSAPALVIRRTNNGVDSRTSKPAACRRGKKPRRHRVQ
jgi:hypothetical protein